MPLSLPPEPKSGDPIRASAFAQLIRYCRSITPRSTESIDWDLLPGGAQGRVKTAGRRSSTAADPFTLTGAVESGTAYIHIEPGLVDNIVPKIGSDSLAKFPRPKISVSGEAGQLWLKNTLDAVGTITASVVETGSSMPADTSTLAYRLLGSFTSASGQFTSVYSALNTNQSHYRCGGVSVWGAA